MVRYAGEQIFEQTNGRINQTVFSNILFNVKANGAKGTWNPVTSTGADDTGAVQATVNAAIAAGGKAVFFPSGNYYVSALTNASSVVFFGDNARFYGIPNPIYQFGEITPDGLYGHAIINGNMDIAQRLFVSSITIATGTSKYTADRIKSTNNGSGANATAAQGSTTDLDGTRFNLQFSHAALPSAGGQLMHFYTLEAKDAYKLAGQQFTVGVNVKAIAGMDRVTLNARYKTTESAITDTSTLISTSGATAINSSSWTIVPLTFNVPSRSVLTTSGVFGVQIVASKTTAEASGDGIAITQLRGNVGPSLLPIQPRSYPQEFIDSVRYCYSLVDESNVNQIIGYGFAASATIAFIQVTFPTAMRTQPVLVATATDFQLTDGGVAIDVTTISVQPGENGRNIITLRVAVAAGLTVNRPYQLYAKAANKIMTFDAEL